MRTHQGGKSWPIKMRLRVLELYRQGARPCDIAIQTGVSPNTVASWLAASSIRRSTPKFDRDYGIRLYLAGFTLREAAAKVGCSESTLRGWMAERDIPRRNRYEEIRNNSRPKRGYERLDEVVRLYYEEELSTTEIAERYGDISPSTVSYTLRNNGYELRTPSEKNIIAWKRGRRVVSDNFVNSSRRKVA